MKLLYIIMSLISIAYIAYMVYNYIQMKKELNEIKNDINNTTTDNIQNGFVNNVSQSSFVDTLSDGGVGYGKYYK